MLSLQTGDDSPTHVSHHGRSKVIAGTHNAPATVAEVTGALFILFLPALPEYPQQQGGFDF